MVTRESATKLTPEEEVHNQVPIPADHSKLVKFFGKSDPNYLLVCSKLKEIVKQAPEILRGRKRSSM